MGRPCGSGLETTQHFQEIVLRVRRKRVSSRVDTDARSTGNVVVEPHVRGFRLIELHVPVAVRRYLFAQLLSQPYLGECGPVRWERSGWECSRTWITLDRGDVSLDGVFHFHEKSVFRRIPFIRNNTDAREYLKKSRLNRRSNYWQNDSERHYFWVLSYIYNPSEN